MVGVRHILDQDASSILTNEVARNNLRQLAEHNLHFELQMFINDQIGVKSVIDIAEQIPELTWVLNHLGFSFGRPWNTPKNELIAGFRNYQDCW